MIESNLVGALAALAAPEGRLDAAASFARELGAEALYAFVRDGELPELAVPAPGFLPTVPATASWRALLGRCLHEGQLGCSLDHPGRDEQVPAYVLTRSGLALVFLNLELVAPPARALVWQLMPMLASLLRQEQSQQVLLGNLQIARETARSASFLAQTLDKTRAQLEGTLQELAEQAVSLQHARREAEDASRVKDEFLAMLGHEMRNPLSPIVTALHILRMQGTRSKELEVIERQVEHLTRLVDDLLDVSRVARGKIELSKRHVEVSTILLQACEMATPLLDQKQQVLHLDVPETGLVLHADPARLAQVFSNLLTNAARYSPAEGHVWLSARRDDDEVVVRVRDQGIGIEREMLDSIFKRFVQAKQDTDRSSGGLGLGLAIVQNLVELHDGTVRAASEGKGLGSEFTVRLPASVRRQSEVPLRVMPATPGTRARILLVDDNEDACELFARALRTRGHVVEEAGDGPTALRMAESFLPTVAVLDIGLPVMDGYELARLLRQQPGQEHCKLIALTGYGLPQDKQRAREAGFDAHLVKPVRIEALESVIAQLQDCVKMEQ
jgi:signal transduction histidine kinase/ActR/RegA family two-component response regulator